MSQHSVTGSLAISPHVRACLCGSQVILLDLRRSHYLSLGGPCIDALALRVQGWPRRPWRPQLPHTSHASRASHASHAPLPIQAIQAIPPIQSDSPGEPGEPGHPVQPPPIDDSVERLAQRLLDQGLVTSTTALQPQQPALAPATDSIEAADCTSPVTIRARDVASFLLSSFKAAWWLRTRSLHDIAQRLVERNRREPQEPQDRRSGAAQPITSAAWPLQAALARPKPGNQATRSAARVFERLRPLGFTTRDRCLHDSLALCLFLGRRRIRAQWVIGVSTHPFAAHAWVQSDAFVLNDHHERTGAYAPIFYV